ncbi:MAG: hypothetical protein IKL30_07050, partial [Anaerotignum sp.]|nr:hypothetical protein [Anaerotignum sp.]
MAKANNTELKVLPLLEPIVEANGLELVDLEFVKEGVNWYLRVYIDKDGGVNIDEQISQIPQDRQGNGDGIDIIPGRGRGHDPADQEGIV